MLIKNGNEKKNKYELSIVFPIYNEEINLKKLIRRINDLKKLNLFDLEIIFVDDGSTDNSKKIIKNYIGNTKTNNKLISTIRNKGKGYAIKTGILKSSKRWILTSDADLSVNLNHILKWFKKKNFLKENKAYFASRNHQKSILIAHFHRKIIGFFYQSIIRILFLNSIAYIRDTQCGFKLYNKNYAKKIFSKVKEKGFVHDIEVAILLFKNDIDIKEVPVKWIHGQYSRVNLIKDSTIMFFKIFFLKFKYKV